MAMFRVLSICDQFDDLLEKERRAVLTGNFEVLKRLVNKKERLIANLSRHREPVERIALIRDKLTRNSQLLRAAEDGIRSVSKFIKSLDEPLPALNTYDQSGSRRSHVGEKVSTERRV